MISMAQDVQDIVRELLAITKMGQVRLGKHAGVSQAAISKWISGKHEPRKPEWDRVIRLAMKNPKTRHLAHRYVFTLLGSDKRQTRAAAKAFFDAVLDSEPIPE